MKEVPNGFYIFTTSNIVFGEYTGNARYPFKFKEVSNSYGVLSPEYVDRFPGSDTLYYIDSANNIAALKDGQVTLLASELTDLFVNYPFTEVFDSVTKNFVSEATQTPISIHCLRGRFLAIKTAYYVYMFDIGRKRYGKLKATGSINRAYSFIYITDFSTTFQGAINTKQVLFNVANVANGVLLLGKFQYARSRWLTVEGVEIELQPNVVGDSVVTTYLLSSFDGRNFNSSLELQVNEADNSIVTYYAHAPGKNHAVLIVGTFAINTLQLDFFVSGDR